MTRHSYFVMMLDHGRRGLEAVVDPEITRSAMIDRIRRKDFRSPIAFIHFVQVNADGVGSSEDVTNQLLAEAGFYDEEAEYA